MKIWIYIFVGIIDGFSPYLHLIEWSRIQWFKFLWNKLLYNTRMKYLHSWSIFVRLIAAQISLNPRCIKHQVLFVFCVGIYHHSKLLDASLSRELVHLTVTIRGTRALVVFRTITYFMSGTVPLTVRIIVRYWKGALFNGKDFSPFSIYRWWH